jgi:hypothetical protein
MKLEEYFEELSQILEDEETVEFSPEALTAFVLIRLSLFDHEAFL